MPCMCWYTPDKEELKKLKNHCEEIVAIVKELRKYGDPIGGELRDVKKLLDHLYNDNCDEKPKENK